MRGLLITTIIVISAYFGYQEIDQWMQQTTVQELAHQKFKQDEAALDAARASNSLVELNQFIFDHPKSQWLERAVFYRDQLAYRQALDSNTPKALQNFIGQYPESRWVPQAKQSITRLENEFLLQQERERQQARLDAQRQQLARRGVTTPGKAAHRDPLKTPGQSSRTVQQASSQDRVARALAIYQKQREQSEQQQYQKQQERAYKAEKTRKCNEISDQLRQYQRNRVRWYELDENGQRVYLSDEQVTASRREMQQFHDKNCS